MNFLIIQRIAKLCFLLLIVYGIVSCAPAQQSIQPQPSEPQLATATASAVVQPTQKLTSAPSVSTLQEARQLIVEWPSALRVGDGSKIMLTLEMDEKGNITPTLSEPDNQSTSEPVDIPNLYETHNLVAEARLDMAGIWVSPQGTISEPMQPGKKVQFVWSVRPSEQGVYRGTLWLYLNIIPKENGEIDRRTILAKDLNLEARSFLGLPVVAARWLGVIGSVAGVVVGSPVMDILIQWVCKRRKVNRVKREDP